MGRRHFVLCPCSESSYFYSHCEESIERRCIGHLRLDFGSGNEFWTSWWPHAAHDQNTMDFKAEFDTLVKQLRKGLFKNRAAMYKYIADHPATVLEDNPPRYYGYSVHTAYYAFYIRCTPERGNYSYIYCYKIHQEDL